MRKKDRDQLDFKDQEKIRTKLSAASESRENEASSILKKLLLLYVLFVLLFLLILFVFRQAL